MLETAVPGGRSGFGGGLVVIEIPWKLLGKILTASGLFSQGRKGSGTASDCSRTALVPTVFFEVEACREIASGEDAAGVDGVHSRAWEKRCDGGIRCRDPDLRAQRSNEREQSFGPLPVEFARDIVEQQPGHPAR